MADGKIYITISDTRGGSGAGVSNDADTEASGSKKSLKDFAEHKFFHLIENEAKQYVNYSIGNIGNFTGNYQAQRDTEAAVNVVNEVIGIGVATLGAFVQFGPGPSGAAAAAIVAATAISTKGVNMLLQEKSIQFENKKVNRNIDIMRNRIGLEGLTNGGRTGNY